MLATYVIETVGTQSRWGGADSYEDRFEAAYGTNTAAKIAPNLRCLRPSRRCNRP